MNRLYDEDEEETKARAATNCPACGIEKDKGLVVCWTCFKKPGGLKYSGLTLSEWLSAQQTAQKYMKQRYTVEQSDSDTFIVADTRLNREVCICGAYDGGELVDGFPGRTSEEAGQEALRIAGLLNKAA